MQPDAVEAWWRRGRLPEPEDRWAGESTWAVSGTDPVLASRHRIGEAAAAAIVLSARWATAWHERRGGPPQHVLVEVADAAASLLGFVFQRCVGLDLGRDFHPLTALYPCGDGRWIHLHGGFPHLADGALRLLGAEATAESIGAAVARWSAVELEDALAEAGLCGAVARSAGEWRDHPAGAAVTALPAVRLTRIADDGEARHRPAGHRPLTGIRVADLTRVLAGPTCGRTLAAHGAEVVRVAGSHLPSIEPFVVDTGRGKRSAFADLRTPEGCRALDAFLAGADVIVQGYRTGSLDRRGFGPLELAERHPGVVVATLNCYGPVGPWAGRRGWEQLAQTASGLATAEGGEGPPRLAPAAATDYTTGYLAAAGVLAALARQADEGGSWLVEVSLAQTAAWIQGGGSDLDPDAAAGVGAPPTSTVDTSWGPLTHLRAPEVLSVTPARWEQAPEPLGSSDLTWAAPTPAPPAEPTPDPAPAPAP